MKNVSIYLSWADDGGREMSANDLELVQKDRYSLDRKYSIFCLLFENKGMILSS